MIARRAAPGLALLALLSAAACSNAATGPRVVLPSGQAITVEVAVTDQEKAQGLMFRESMPRDAGMVFPFEGLEIRPFWMKNCHFPLDMIYTTKDGTVVDVLRNVTPCAADPAPCDSVAPKAKADTVLEVNAGVAEAGGAVPGARLKFISIPGR